MKYSNSIEYNISTKFDSSGLTKLQTQIREVELSLQKMSNAGNFAPTIEKARNSLQGLNKALTNAFNPSLGIIDISKFRAELAKGKVDLEGVASGFRLAGTQGQTAFNSLIGQLGRFDSGISRTSSALDKMFVTFQNTFRWGLISSFFSSFMNAIHQSVQYAKDLDDSLTQIMLVTDYSRDNMNEYAKAANEAAKAVGQTTVGMTNASLIFAQQGYDLDQSQQLATLSAKLANASQQDTAATSDQITAYMNAYGLQDSMDELVQAMDNWAKIANISAADVEEIALASQRAASMANAVGVSGEALAAQIATIESVTREAPEQIGNGLKTLYARFSDLKLGKDDEDGIGLGKVTSTLQQIGVQVLDAFGNVRDMDDIMEDLMTVWQDLDDTSKTAAAQALAGKHQVNRFMALMENSDMYQEYLGATGEGASGTLEQMNQEYLDSLQGRTAKLQATLEGLFNDVFTTDMVYPLIDVLTKLAEVFDTLFKSVGGGPTIILGLASAFTQLFSKQIANAITDASMNRELAKIQAENYKNAPAALSQLGLANPNANNENTKSLLNFAQQGAQFASNMSEEGLKQYNSLLDENVRLTNAAENAHKEFTDTLSSLNAILGTTIQETDAIFTDENGLNTSVLTEVLRELKDSDFEGNKNQIDAAITKVQEYIGALENLEIEIKEYKKTEDSTGEGTNKIGDAVQRVREAAITLGEAGGLSKEQLEALKKSINDVDTQTENWENEAKDALAEIQRLAGGAENLKKILEQLSNSKSLSPEKARAIADQLDRAYSNDQATQGAKDNINRLGQGFIDVQKIAASRKEILDTVGAIGQLAFAWRSLSNLPSIWDNKDLTLNEKMLQTFTNLAAVIPSLIISFQKLGITDSFKNLPNAFKTIWTGKNTIGEREIAQKEAETRQIAATEAKKIAMDKLAAATEKAKIAQDKLNAAEAKQKGGFTKSLNQKTKEREAAAKDAAEAEAELNAANKALKDSEKDLDAANKALSNSWSTMGNVIVTIVIAAIMAAISAYSAYLEKVREAARQSVEEFNNNYEKTQIDTSNFDELYKRYKETGIASDDLTQAGKDLAQQLGIVGGSALAASGNFEELAKQIAASREEAQKKMELDSVLALQNLNEEANTLFGNKSPWLQLGMDYSQWEDLSITEKRGAVNQKLADTQAELNSLLEEQKELENSGQSNTRYANDINRRIDLLRQLESRLQEISNADYFEGLDDIVSVMAESTLSKLSESDFSGQTSTEIMQALLDPTGEYEWIARQYELLGEEAGRKFLAGIMSQLDPKNANLYSLLAGDFSILGDKETSIDITGLTPEMMQQFGYEDYDAFVAALQEKAAQGITLTPEINIESRYDFDSDEEINKYLEDYTDIDRDTLEMSTSLRMEEYAPEGNRFTSYDTSEQERNLAQARQNVADTVGAGNEAESAAQKELTDAQKEYDEALQDTSHDAEQYEKAMRKSAAAAARMVKTLDDMNDHFDDNREILEDGNKSTIDYAEALVQTKEDLAGLLDIDPSMLSNEFASSSEALDAMNTMLHGTQEEAEAAYETLRQLAAEDVINNLDIPVEFTTPDGSQTFSDEYIRSTLTDMISSLDSQDLSIGMEADINTEEWYARVNELLRSGALTADQLTQVLSAAGYKGELRYEKGEGWTTETTYEIHASGNQTVGEGESAMSWPTEITMIPHYKTVLGQDVDIPVLEGATQTGGFVNQGGGGHQSGGGRGGGGGGCFVAGTLVSLQNQFKNIEDIQIGDIVLSYNEEIHQNEYSIVLQTMIHDVTEEIYDLYIEDEILTVTGIHRFYVRRKHNIEWIPASDLHIGDYVLFADGNWHPIFKIKVKIRSLLVYNFEVSHNHNYYVGRNQILAHNKGGGGGGGKAKTIQPKEKKEHKKDYYEKVDSQLDKLKEQLSGIEKQEDRLIGDKARANQAKQIALIRKEIDLEKERLKILQDTKDSELKDVRAAITAKDTAAQDILKGRGIKFNIPEPEYDENGIITNYEKISEKIDEAHNKLIDQYNAAAKAGNEDLTKTIEEAIKKYDDYSGAILENVQRQNDIQKEIESTKNTIQELEDSIEDIQIELYKASMEAIDNLKDLNEKWAEFEGFLTGMPTDSPFRDLTVDLLKLNSTFEIGKEDAAKYYQEIIDGKIAAQNATTDQAEKEAIQASINYFVGLRDGLTDDMLNNGLLGLAMEDLKQLEKWYKDPSLKDNPFGNNQKALAEAYQEGYERVLELSQDWQDLQEDIIDSVISGYDEIADKQDRQLGKYTRLADQLEQLADEYALSYGDESYQALSDIGKQQGETLRAQLQQYKEIYEYWKNEYQEALKTGNEELINSIEDHMNDVEDEMRDIANEAAETFVDAYEKAVDAAIQKMNKTLIGEADFDRLDRNWEWQDRMIEGYLDDVEKAYEIEKLRGDYMDMLNEAQGASLATQNKIRAAMNEQLQLLEDQTTVSQFDVDLANARLLVLQKQIALEDAQRNKNQMQLRRDSQGNYRYVYRANQDEIAKARKELLDAEREVYKMSQDHMKEVRQNVADAINEFIDQWRTISTDPNLSEDQRKEQLEELVNNIKPILAVYAEDLKNGSDGIAIALGDMINTSTDEMAVAASDMLSKIYNEEGNLAEKTGTLWWDVVAKFTNEIFPNIDSAIATLATTTYGEMDQLRNNLTGPDGVIPDVTDALVGEDGFRPALIAAADAITNEDPTQGLNAAMKSLGDSLEAENTKLKEGINNITNYTTALAGAITTLSQAQGAIIDLQKITLGDTVYQFRAEVQDNTQNASPNIEAASYDTGGYTGDWGEDGKIAVLHQKELILNAEDTRNILSAVDIVRQMTSTLGNVLANYSIGDTPNSLASSVFNTVDQRVEIKAEFPNVKDAFEIETALTNLSDKAYQYAHRKI